MCETRRVSAPAARSAALALLDRDLRAHPDRLVLLPTALLERARATSAGVVVDHQADSEGAVPL